MNVLLYACISVLIIMVWHLAFSTKPNNFGIFQMIGVFILGGIAGWVMDSIELAVLMSIVLSLIFI